MATMPTQTRTPREPEARAARRSRGRGGAAWRAAFVLGLAAGGLMVLAAELLVRDEAATVPPPPPAAARPDVRVTLSPDLLAALIRRSLAQAETPLSVENLRVTTGDGLVRVRGDIGVAGQPVQGLLVLRPEVEAGRLRTRVVESRLGRLPVPGDLGPLIEGQINARVNAALSDLPAEITAVHADATGLTVSARVRLHALP
jgi:hypothetical protein